MRSLNELQALEEAAWASPERRALYSTRYVPGFPWHTVQESDNSIAASSAVVRRHVVPYDYAFTVFVKGRWVGRRLLQVYAEELLHHPPAYYEACLRSGRLRCVQRAALGRHNTQRKLLKRSSAPRACSSPPVDTPVEVGEKKVAPTAKLDDAGSFHPGTTTTTDAVPSLTSSPFVSEEEDPVADLNVVLQHGDVVYHTVHRHEIPVVVGASGVDPVCITAVRIVAYGLICVNKPTGLPTHATGRYMYNSLTALLEYVLAPKRLHAWLMAEDPLLQSLVSTAGLTLSEKEELFAYYAAPTKDTAESHANRPLKTEKVAEEKESKASEVDPSKLPRPCHRLDKVTSGVLLLAVQQDAARRIGTILMQKAKEVDEAVAAELLSGRRKKEERVRDDGKPLLDDVDRDDASAAVAASSLVPASLQRVLGRRYELQKYYLARVSGTFTIGTAKNSNALPCADASSGLVWQLFGTEACLAHHNDDLHSLLSSSSSWCAGQHPMAGEFPGGLLITKPMPLRSHHGAATDGDGASEASTSNADVAYGDKKHVSSSSISAATLCQTLPRVQQGTVEPTAVATAHHAAAFAPSSDTESLVLCTPYTGRLHQIRWHLSSLGCPIVGDVVYAAAPRHGDFSLQSAQDHQPPPREKADATASGTEHPNGSDASLRTRNERDYLYFDASQLPSAYLRFCNAQLANQASPVGETRTAPPPAAAAATTTAMGAKRYRADSAGRSSDVVSGLPAWQREPPCYECAGRLPIVAAKECATGTSAVCLHAWVYEVRESLLLPHRKLTGDTDVARKATEDRAALRTSERESQRVGDARATAGGFVRFEATPPSWARIASSSNGV